MKSSLQYLQRLNIIDQIKMKAKLNKLPWIKKFLHSEKKNNRNN